VAFFVVMTRDAAKEDIHRRAVVEDGELLRHKCASCGTTIPLGSETCPSEEPGSAPL
jgi:hypothetical protein